LQQIQDTWGEEKEAVQNPQREGRRCFLEENLKHFKRREIEERCGKRREKAGGAKL